MSKNIAVLAGDGIGPEIIAATLPILQSAHSCHFMQIEVGGAAYTKYQHPLPKQTLDICEKADAILFGAVGDPKFDQLDRHLRPEQAILGLRKHFALFANFRPALLYPSLVHASTLKPEVVEGLDMLVIRELNGDVYFGQPRGIRQAIDGLFIGAREGFDTMRYSEPEVSRIAHVAFQAAQKRRKKLCSIDKANVLETSQLWRDVVQSVHMHYPDIELSHMYVDNAAMQMIKNPKAFDVLLTPNLFGDILSDASAMLTGSIGMLPSASLNAQSFGLYEPSHGSAPDIAGKDMANPLATILSAAMLLRFSLHDANGANAIEKAVAQTLEQGYRTIDIATKDTPKHHILGTKAMGDAVLKCLNQILADAT